MTCFIQLTEEKYIHVTADRMELRDDTILVWNGPNMVAVADLSVVLFAQITENGGKK